ncbi:MAG TPA: PASTA domain-containing protein [Acidimicrobiales bacterium]
MWASFTPALSSAATSHAPVRVPRLIGHNRAQVYAQLRRAGLFFVTYGPGSATSHWVEAIGQSPRPGTLVPFHSTVRVHVTSVTPRGPRIVPRLVGLTRAQVYAQMRRTSLYFTTIGPGASNGTWSVAVSQSPAPGTVVAWHARVVVHVITRTPHAVAFAAPRGVDEAAAIAAGRYKYGVATWYSYVPGRCATWFLPMGTVVTVRDLATGHTISCTVTDHEAPGTNHIIDLSETQFAQLAPLPQGVINVRVTW